MLRPSFIRSVVSEVG